MKCWVIWAISITALIGVILLCVLLPISFKSLDPTEVGLDYDSINYKIDDTKLYTEGRYFLGVGHDFKVFPYTIMHAYYYRTNILQATMDANNNPLPARTIDGLKITVYVSYQYQLIISLDNIVALYYQWGDTGYNDAFFRMVRSCLIDSVAKFTAIQMYNNRTGVNNKINI